MKISEVDYKELPLSLLLEADPSEQKIGKYLPRSICFVAREKEEAVGVCAVLPLGEHVYELMNIAVGPKQKGIGTQLLSSVIVSVKAMGARKLLVGTGTFGYQLAFYQRAGFRVISVDQDFFLRNYDEAIFEDGIQHKDMLKLEIEF